LIARYLRFIPAHIHHLRSSPRKRGSSFAS
jgi:hypothetical protein